MSSKEYINLHDHQFNDKQRDIMTDLWMSGVNHDGHVWVTWSDIEEVLVKLFKYNKEK